MAFYQLECIILIFRFCWKRNWIHKLSFLWTVRLCALGVYMHTCTNSVDFQLLVFRLSSTFAPPPPLSKRSFKNSTIFHQRDVNSYFIKLCKSVSLAWLYMHLVLDDNIVLTKNNSVYNIGRTAVRTENWLNIINVLLSISCNNYKQTLHKMKKEIEESTILPLDPHQPSVFFNSSWKGFWCKSYNLSKLTP